VGGVGIVLIHTGYIAEIPNANTVSNGPLPLTRNRNIGLKKIPKHHEKSLYIVTKNVGLIVINVDTISTVLFQLYLEEGGVRIVQVQIGKVVAITNANTVSNARSRPIRNRNIGPIKIN